MDVSHFELVFKPQSPVPPADTVLQGYFLEISNLENKPYSYRLEFVTSSITDPDRSLFGNTIVFVDTPGLNNAPGTFSLVGGLAADSFRMNRLITVPARGTALVALLPSDPFSMQGGPPAAPNFECRGYVRLTLPAIFQKVGPFFTVVPQSAVPVKVMLTPQNRSTYLSPAGVINDQTQSSVPTASGKAVNEVPPGQPFGLGDLLGTTIDPLALSNLVETTDFRPEMLAGLLDQVAGTDGDLSPLNALLADAGIALALERRKPAHAAAMRHPEPV